MHRGYIGSMSSGPKRGATTAILLAVVAGCSVGNEATPRAESAALPATWKQAMKQVGRHFEVLENELARSPAGDLRAVADEATAAAALLRLGYGRFRTTRVADFGRMARDTESWLLRIAAEAGQGHGAIAQDLFRGGEERHCTRCHDRSEAASW